jgi:DNA (cytosine-5)-methyltransferase 1
MVVGPDNGGGKGHVHPHAPRELTPRESARLQSSPDFWEFSGRGKDAIRQEGNAVPPVFAAALASHPLEKAFGGPQALPYGVILDRLGLDYLKRAAGAGGSPGAATALG